MATPLAPVTLALTWSPFPLAARLFKPGYTHAVGGNALAVFDPCIQSTANYSTPDEQHFLFLAAEASRLASVRQARILLVGAPGWDYEEAGNLVENPVIQEAMVDFGYVYTLRRPSAG